ncbi:hypothetical protein FQN54_005409 [Arachnomyces sp. PD_36]|nr:hypothetical protein FQN54_005409 [Arachnomyces sp. PD_36]
MEILHSPPSESSFTPLAEHQSQTPESFYDGPPILHHLSRGCKIVALERDLRSSPALRGLRGENGGGAAAAATNGESEEDKEVIVDGVDVWVGSEKLLLYATSARGVAIPYPSISLHAIQRLRLPGSPEGSEMSQGVYMQLAGSSPDEENDEEEDSVALTIVPPVPAEEPAETAAVPVEEEDKPTSPAQALFAALSACSNLHPDPILQEEDMDDMEDDDMQGSSLYQAGLIQSGDNSGSGGLPPPMGGSSGWITAENMHEYFDEEGNWRGEGPGPNPLGPGAGIVREREGGDDDMEGGGDGPDGDETKWRRTE